MSLINFIEVGDTGKLEIRPEVYLLSPFDDLFERHQAKDFDKELAIKEIGFIYWSGLAYSYYFVNADDVEKVEEAYKQIKLDLGLLPSWKPSMLIQNCIEKFREIQRTKSFAAFETLEANILATMDYLKDINYKEKITEGSRKGELLNNIKIANDVAKQLPDLIKKAEEIKKQMVEEYNTKINVRGKGLVNKFEKIN